jgi:Xaa-Pro aminopeptidase
MLLNNKYFILVLSFILSLSLIINILTDSNSQKVVKEILESHVDEIVVEENYTNFKELSLKMTALKFKIESTKVPELEGLRMIGAKYFNLNEAIGAQIKFRDESKKVVTLYEFKSEEDLDELNETFKINDKRYKAKLWKKNDVYFLIVRSLRPYK